PRRSRIDRVGRHAGAAPRSWRNRAAVEYRAADLSLELRGAANVFFRSVSRASDGSAGRVSPVSRLVRTELERLMRECRLVDAGHLAGAISDAVARTLSKSRGREVRRGSLTRSNADARSRRQRRGAKIDERGGPQQETAPHVHRSNRQRTPLRAGPERRHD